MKPDQSHAHPCGRRAFLSQVSATAAAGLVLGSTARAESPQTPPAAMPMVSIGKYQVSRLVVGSNPINGYSYMGEHADRHMKEYFTVERTVEFYQRCEHEGITTLQFSPKPEITESLRKLREQGSKMQAICLHSDRAGLKSIVNETQPIAISHHGGATDRLFGQGKSQRVHDYVKAVHDLGLLAGMSAHNPECIQRAAEEGWEVDFFMTCFYFLTRAYVPGALEKIAPLQTLEFTYPFVKDDPKAMTQVVRQVKQPCLGFKILGAGRLCSSQETVKAAFQFAFANLKPSDGVIVGMYPRFFDEIQANAQYVREFGKRA
jgi:hypothetical protein